MICRFYFYKLTYTLKFICNLKISTHSAFLVIGRAVGILRCPVGLFPAEIQQGNSLPSCFSSPATESVFSMVLFSAMLFVLFVFTLCWPFYWWCHCLKWPPSTGLKGCLVFLSTGRPWCTFLAWKVCVLDKLHPGMSYVAAGCEFSVHRSTIYSQKKKKEIGQSVHEAAPSSTKVTSLVCDQAMEE